MTPFWIKADGIRLAIIQRPRGQEWLSDDIKLLRREGVDMIVSALTAAENEELGLAEERRSCNETGVEFGSFPIGDRSVPNSTREFSELLDRVTEYLHKDKSVAVHCRAGIGRSSIIAASILIRSGHSVESAFRAIEEARGCSVPDTEESKAMGRKQYALRTVKS